MAVLSKAEIAALSPEERLELIDDLWESLNHLAGSKSTQQQEIPDWQKRILDERLSELQRFSADDIGLSEARDRSLL